MLWLFVILGLVTSGSVLCRLSVSEGARRRFWPSLAATALLLVVAWAAQHTTAIGWFALLIAFILEAVQWVARLASRRTTTAPPLQPITVPEEVQGSPPEAGELLDPEPLPSHEIRTPPRSFTTVALLRTAWEPAAEVFLASLRRTGQRDAGLSEESEEDRSDRIRVRVGTMRLDLATFRTAVTQSQIDYAAEQAWDWPEAAEHVAGHSAHVTLTTQYPAEAAPCTVVQLHHRAHSALAEFAPVVGILWPDACRLLPAASLSDHCGSADDAAPTRCCVNFRVFPLEGAETGHFVADTVGLHAFDLPDIQVVTDREPDDVISAVLYDLAERFFRTGCDLEEGQELHLPSDVCWRVRKTSSRFPPDRSVIQLDQVPA